MKEQKGKGIQKIFVLMSILRERHTEINTDGKHKKIDIVFCITLLS